MRDQKFRSLLLAAWRLRLVARSLMLVACGLMLAARSLALEAWSLALEACTRKRRGLLSGTRDNDSLKL
jgi:hypothetical protein